MPSFEASSRLVYLHGTSAVSQPPSDATVLENNLAAMMKNGALLLVGPVEPQATEGDFDSEAPKVAKRSTLLR